MKKKLPIFTSPEGRDSYLITYEDMFSLWKVPHRPIEVNTRFGMTHINASGPKEGFPLVLLHGAGLSSTVWFPLIAELSARHRVYAIDTIGDAGKSVADRLLQRREDYSDWLKDVLDGLKLEQCDMVGHSYGGWLTLNMARAYRDRLRKIVLLAPAASFLELNLLTKLFFFLGEFKISPPTRSVLKKVSAKGTVLEEKFLHFMETVNRYCTPAMIYPTVFTDTELAGIDLPALYLIGDGDRIYNKRKAIARAQRCMPKLTAEIIPDAGHLFIMDQPDMINERILNFLSHDGDSSRSHRSSIPGVSFSDTR